MAKAHDYEQQEPLGITFIHDDAQHLTTLPAAHFDGVMSNMALTDIPDLQSTLHAVARVLRPGGWLIFSITHPCFQTADSQWVTDEGATRRQVGEYFVEGFWRSDYPHGVRGKVGAYHRTLTTYLNSLRAAGFSLEQISEPQASGSLAERVPGNAVVPATLLVYCRRDSVH